MTPDSVVEHLDGLEQAGPCLRPRGVALVVDQLLLRAGEEALRGRVVPAVRPTAHATGDPMPGQQPPIMLAGIPAPAIRMGHQTLAGLATGPGRFESVDDQPAVDPRAHRPAHDPPRMQVLHHRQVGPTLAGRDMSDVGRPGPIGRPGMVSRLFSARRRRRSSSKAGGLPLPEKARSPALARARFRARSMLSPRSRSRATSARPSPCSVTSLTASALNSGVNALRVFA